MNAIRPELEHLYKWSDSKIKRLCPILYKDNDAGHGWLNVHLWILILEAYKIGVNHATKH